MKALNSLFLAGLLMAVFSCAALGDQSATPAANVFSASPELPPTLKRVLVLPLTCEGSEMNLSDGCQMLDPVLRASLIKTGEFEVVAADPETLRRCTGKMSWMGTEVLPADFFTGLKNIYGCDAVLFCQLTQFRPSPPLAVGWRLKLVDVETGKIIWAADGIFDAGKLAVAKDAEAFERREQPRNKVIYEVYSFLAWCINVPTRSALDDQWSILHSPSYFAEYSAQKLLDTMPQR
jgi:hypothetical protein